MQDIQMNWLTLEQSYLKQLSYKKAVIDEINNDYDNAIGTLVAHNNNLAGKIAVNLSVQIYYLTWVEEIFRTCFRQYLITNKNLLWHISLETLG